MPLTPQYNQDEFTRIQNSIDSIGLITSDASVSDLERNNLSNEVSGGGYSRQPVSLTLVQDGFSQRLIFTSDITFPTPSSDWGFIRYVGFFSGSELWFFSYLNTVFVGANATVTLLAETVGIK